MKILNKLLNNKSLSITELNDLSVDQVISLEKQLDEFFQLKYKEIESKLLSQKNNYSSDSYIENELESNALNNSYLDFYKMALSLNIQEHESFVDLGAGYCKAGLSISLFNPNIKVQCLEFVKERVLSAREASKKLDKHNAHFIVQDLLDHQLELPIANYYFIYLPNGKLLESLLKRLKLISKSFSFKLIVIESHGELVNRIRLESSWLEPPQSKLKTMLPRHDNQIYVFQTRAHHKATSELESSIHKLEQVIYCPKQSELVFKDIDHGQDTSYLWSASSLDAQLNLLELNSPKLELRFPPKIMPIANIESINSSLCESYESLFKRRDQNEDFRIYLKNKNKEVLAGKLRKIILKEDVELEFSKVGRISSSKIEIL